MHKLFCLMGKSASGKDTIFRSLLLDESLGLHRVIPYTTRPIREGEENGREYYFVSPEQFEATIPCTARGIISQPMTVRSTSRLTVL